MLKFFLICFLLFNTCFAEQSNFDSQIDKKQFLDDYQVSLDIVFSKFNTQNSPLTARVFDISDKQVYGFLSHSIKWEKTTEEMANVYYPIFYVKEKQTSFCFILYDGDSKLVQNYMTSGLSYEDVVKYLTYHEMGHCFESYLNQLNNIKITTNKSDTELFADIFALASAENENNEILAKKIIELNKTINKNDYHYQPMKLEKSLLLINNKMTKNNKSMNNLIEESKNIYFDVIK